MTESTAVIIGALVGAVSGIAVGGFAALASFRASLVMARVPLGPVLHEISRAVIRMHSAQNSSEQTEALLAFEVEWNKFAIQQRILCPSERISSLMDLVRSAVKRRSENLSDLSNLAAQVVEKISQMVGAHSNRLFRFRARMDEARILKEWLTKPESQLLSEPLREILMRLADGRIAHVLVRFRLIAGSIPALTLVGWYLMVPPPKPRDVDNTAPLSRWEVVAGFNSPQECTQALGEFRAGTERKITDPAMPKDERQFFLGKSAFAQCIATDDPRLKAQDVDIH